MADVDNFMLNVLGVTDLVENDINKVAQTTAQSPEGATGEKRDVLDIDMTDEELLKMRDQYEQDYAKYEGILKPRVEKIRKSYLGKTADGSYLDENSTSVANLQFEAEETFLAAALAKNPEPVVYADNSPEGAAMANAVKTMLQYHSDQLVIRRKLTLMVRQWSVHLIGVLKPGWNHRINDVAIDNAKAGDYIFDPKGHVDAYGDFTSWFGERKKIRADKLVEMFPKKKTDISLAVAGQMGTEVTYTEWWPSDEYCFYTFKTIVLDKHKNHLYNWPEPELDGAGMPRIDPETLKPMMTKPRNHFAHPKKPAIFLSVFSLQEQPHDITSLIEQNIANQDRIRTQTEQIDTNIASSNNGYAFSEANFNQETGKQASNARKKGNPILIPQGGPMSEAIMPLPAQPLPEGYFRMLETHKNDLKNSWGIQGIASQQPDEDQTARGMILNQSHDTSRIGGGIGDAIEQVADNTFNWLVQLYYVFYDEEHFAAIMGGNKAIEYVTLSQANLTKQVIVSVAPDSLKPKDEVTQMNLAQALFDKKAIGPKTLLKMLDFPDAEQAAADGVLYALDPMAYFQLNFPEEFAKMQQSQMEQAQIQMAQQATAAGMTAGAEAAAVPPEQANGEPAKPVSLLGS